MSECPESKCQEDLRWAVKALSSAVQNRPSQRDFKWDAAIAQLRRQVDILTTLYEENKGLCRRYTSIESSLQVLQREELWLRRAHPLYVIRSSDTCLSGYSSRGASFGALPDPSGWTPEWEGLVRGFTTADLVTIHRQMLQETSILLPRAEILGSGTEAYVGLVSLQDKYSCFTQRAISLIPDVWYRRSFYNMETMELIDVPFTPITSAVVRRVFTSENLQVAHEACIRLLTETARLAMELEALKLTHKQLTTTAASSVGPRCASAHGPLPVMVKTEDTTADEPMEGLNADILIQTAWSQFTSGKKRGRRGGRSGTRLSAFKGGSPGAVRQGGEPGLGFHSGGRPGPSAIGVSPTDAESRSALGCTPSNLASTSTLKHAAVDPALPAASTLTVVEGKAVKPSALSTSTSALLGQDAAVDPTAQSNTSCPDSYAATTELHSLAHLMAVNMNKQTMAVKFYMATLQGSLPPVTRAKVNLCMYPLGPWAQDYLDVFQQPLPPGQADRASATIVEELRDD